MRRTPYTEIGIRRKKCYRCGKRSTTQWQICSLKREFLPLCPDCDIALNELVLRFMRLPKNLRQLLQRIYRKHRRDTDARIDATIAQFYRLRNKARRRRGRK